MNAKHTPAPWKSSGGTIFSADPEKYVGCTGAMNRSSEDIANAALIVRAVNAHDDLVKLAEKAAEPCPFELPPLNDPGYADVYDRRLGWCDGRQYLLEKMASAIIKALNS